MMSAYPALWRGLALVGTVAILSGVLAVVACTGRSTGVVEKAAWELADMESMLRAAEALNGPYAWGRWDAIVLPPSFPYGGMENPTLTFLTPPFLAGDRSLVGLVAHELAHADPFLKAGRLDNVEERHAPAGLLGAHAGVAERDIELGRVVDDDQENAS